MLSQHCILTTICHWSHWPMTEMWLPGKANNVGKKNWNIVHRVHVKRSEHCPYVALKIEQIADISECSLAKSSLTLQFYSAAEFFVILQVCWFLLLHNHNHPHHDQDRPDWKISVTISFSSCFPSPSRCRPPPPRPPYPSSTNLIPAIHWNIPLGASQRTINNKWWRKNLRWHHIVFYGQFFLFIIFLPLAASQNESSSP